MYMADSYVVFVRHGEKLLLMKRASEDFLGQWDGIFDFGDGHDQNAVIERVSESTGISSDDLIFVRSAENARYIEIGNRLSDITPVLVISETETVTPSKIYDDYIWVDPGDIAWESREKHNSRTLCYTNSQIDGSDFSGSRMQHVILAEVDLSEGVFEGVDLSNVKLNDRDLSKIKFHNAILKGVDFTNSNLSNSDLSNAYLNSATLTNANFQNANLLSADFGGADLTNVDFSGADLKQVYVKNSKMENIVTNSDTKTDSCFKTDIINKIICKIFRIFTPSSPPYETTDELLANYVLRSNSG